MSSGKKKKPKKVKPSLAKNVFYGYDEFNVGLDGISSGKSVRDTQNKKFDTSGTLAPGLQSARDSAISGFNNNLGFLARTPDQHAADLDAGLNLFYNAQRAANQKLAQQQLGDAQLRYSQSGMENSTARGGFEAELANEAAMLDLQTRLQSLLSQNEMALSNFGAQDQAINSLANLQLMPAQMAQNQAMEAFGSVNQNHQFNANQKQAVDQFNAQRMDAYNQSRGNSFGQMLGGGLGVLGGLAAAPFTGGASLFSIPASVGSMFGAQVPSIPTTGLSSAKQFNPNQYSFLNSGI